MTTLSASIDAAAIISGARPVDPDTVLRPMIPNDADLSRALFREDRMAQFPDLHEPMLTTLLDQQFRAQQIGYRQGFPEAAYLAIEHRRQAVGRVIVALGMQAGEFTLHLVDIVLAPAARRRGIGTDVIACLGRAARDHGATQIRLSVLRANSSAQRLYARLGFAACGDDGVRIAMVKRLP